MSPAAEIKPPTTTTPPSSDAANRTMRPGSDWTLDRALSQKKKSSPAASPSTNAGTPIARSAISNSVLGPRCSLVTGTIIGKARANRQVIPRIGEH